MEGQTPTRTSAIVVSSERKSTVEQLTDDALAQLRQALEKGHSQALKQWLVTMSRFHRYSWGNVLLIAFQNPNATRIAGFHAWRTHFKRFVKRGEKGIMIMAPVMRAVDVVDQPDGKCEADSVRRIVNVKAVYVFDVSQTEGEPLPEFAEVGGDPKTHLERLKDYVRARGIQIEYSNDLGTAQGVSCCGTIRLQTGQSLASEFSVLAHEYAHETLHNQERRTSASRTVLETEAEAVAFVVCHAIGLETGTASSDYIQLYRGNDKTLTESLQLIRSVSAELIAAIQQPL
jgi:antirestriction protein ArdC